ncbi:methyltransferase domain protein [Ancylostoma duodenale]|uniref:Methyltransferase domain protein n=1 Tax=Ancylostoma duodenale TaxID=51022 RepID=A0A0C2E0W4_9BILA|nr:methyltransferase domain protein [Ancylostoma duodenale]
MGIECGPIRCRLYNMVFDRASDTMEQIGVDGVLSAAIALGCRLKLFGALASVSSEEKPATPAQVAEASGCKERYVQEWLAVMGAGDVITVTKDEKYFIPKEHIATSLAVRRSLQDLTGGVAVMLSSFLPVFMRGYDKISEVFGKDGPLGLRYSDFADFYVTMASFSEALHKKHLISDFIPALGPDMKERLKEGGMMCLDVGCGKGFHAALLAENFPKSNFTGIDVTLEAVHLANQQRKDNGQTFDNLAFIQMDAGKMDADWENKYDVVTIFDACHDQMRPDLCLKEIYRVLKPGGVFGMLEVLFLQQSSGGHVGNGEWLIQRLQRQAGDGIGGDADVRLLNVPLLANALGLGAMWGKERAVKLLEEAGFKDITVLPTPQFVINILYVCKKD